MSRRWMIVISLVLASVLAGGSLAQQRGGGPPGGPPGRGGGGPPQANPVVLMAGPQRWEYGRLDCIIERNGKDSTATVMWHGPAGERADAKNFADLYIKLGGTAEAPQEWDDLDVWNLLGEKGWEYVGREINNVAGAGGKTVTSARFKRIKR